MFVKYSDGKITSIIKSEEELDEQQKKAVGQTIKTQNVPSKNDDKNKKLES